jgi:glycosyltransferase involved in cell wall biosynthesis
MAWRLYQSGMTPVAVIVEKRSRIISKRKRANPSFLFRLGLSFLWKRVLEAVRIRSHFYSRKLLGRRFKDPSYLSIEELALDYPIRLYEVEDHNGVETQELLWRLEPDIGILTNTRRIQKGILGLARHGFLNLHLSALPQYAGLDSIFWALYYGEKEIGVTVHFAAEEIDRGDIVLQRKIPVSSLDTEGSLYAKALWLGTHLMIQAIRQLEEGSLQRQPQDLNKLSYFSWPTARERDFFRKLQRMKKVRSINPSEKRVHVLHIITRMIRGGAQENTLATIRGLMKKGYDVTLVTGLSWGSEGEILSEVLENGLEVIILQELVREIHLWKDFLSLWRLSALLGKKDYVILHTHTSKAGFLGRLAARLRRIPIVIHTPHGHVFHSYFSPLKEKLLLGIERTSAKWCGRLIALTDAERREHLALGVGRPDQWHVIPSGVSETDFADISFARRQEIRTLLGIGPEKRIVGFIGRLTSIKGALYLLEAIPKIRKIFPETHFLFVGDGDEKPALEEQVQKYSLEDSVIFAGHKENVSELLALLDILVVPSLNEGMGRVIAEAGLLRKPVVGTRVGGIPDLLENNETGLLVNPRSPDEIAQAVEQLLKDPELCIRLGGHLHDHVLNGFTENQMVEKVHCLYQNQLKEKGILRDTDEIGISSEQTFDQEIVLSGSGSAPSDFHPKQDTP